MTMSHAEPRSALLWAIWFTGVALAMLAAKGHTWAIVGEIGKMLTTGTSGWFLARAWYTRRDVSRLSDRLDALEGRKPTANAPTRSDRPNPAS